MTRNIKKHRYVTKEGLKAYHDKFKEWAKDNSSTFAGTAGDAEKLGGELPEHYATAQSVTDEANARKEADTAIQNDLNEEKNTHGTAEATYDATNKRFVVSGMTFTAASLTRTRFVIKMASKVTEMGLNGKVWLSIGGLNHPVKWFGDAPSPSRSWEAGEYVDVWWDSANWYATRADGSRYSYEKWGECMKIEKP